MGLRWNVITGFTAAQIKEMRLANAMNQALIDLL
jgi:hypothetical protein